MSGACFTCPTSRFRYTCIPYEYMYGIYVYTIHIRLLHPCGIHQAPLTERGVLFNLTAHSRRPSPRILEVLTGSSCCLSSDEPRASLSPPHTGTRFCQCRPTVPAADFKLHSCH